MQESDREKLHLARQRHAIEEQQADSDALKERRKEERAAKRAARKEAASQQLAEMSVANSATPGIKNISRSKVTAGSTSASRYSLEPEKHFHSKKLLLRSELHFGLDEYSKMLFKKQI